MRARACVCGVQLSILMYSLGAIVVPNLTPLQKAAIHRITRKVVGSVTSPAWEKQAINKAVRITRSTPQTVCRVCEKEARKFDNLSQQPPSMCHAMIDVPGTLVHIDGHVALVPIHIPYPDGSTARPNDPLPLPGQGVRDQVIKDLTQLATQIGAVNRPVHQLPHSLWPKTGSKLKYIR